jgi:hypothetical protein
MRLSFKQLDQVTNTILPKHRDRINNQFCIFVNPCIIRAVSERIEEWSIVFNLLLTLTLFFSN